MSLRRIPPTVAILAALLVAGCAAHHHPATQPSTQPATQPGLKFFEYAQLHMGVQVRLSVYAPDQETSEAACKAAYKRIAELEDIMSDYRPTSELMRLCAKAGGPPVPVSDELFYVLQKSLEISKESNGAFDITVGPYVQIWRNARKTNRFPSQEDLDKARPLVGYDKIVLDEETQTVRLKVAGMKLDLGGIGKGYAGDCAIAVLRSYGITSACFEAGGDIVCSDAPPGKYGWIIQITNDMPGVRPRKIFAENCAISTSGDTFQFLEYQGKRYSHIVNPKTGVGLINQSTVSIVAPNGITSDPLSKVACILGPTRTKSILLHHAGTSAYFRPEQPR